MFWNKKNKNDDSENQNYEYKFRRNGSIIQKPTESEYSYAKIKSNPALKGLKGVDDYSEFTSKDKKNNLIYKFKDSSDITDFNFSDNPNKEKRAAKRAEKGRSRRGSAFTINDDKVADELYRAVAGNSDVEYGRIRYNKNGEAKITNYIETDKNREQVETNIKPFLDGDSQVAEITHNHPFRIGKVDYNSKYPSEKDKNGYSYLDSLLKTNDNYAQLTPLHTLYHPVTPDKVNMPYYISFDDQGAMGNNLLNIDKNQEDKYEALYQKQYVIK